MEVEEGNIGSDDMSMLELHTQQLIAGRGNKVWTKGFSARYMHPNLDGRAPIRSLRVGLEGANAVASK